MAIDFLVANNFYQPTSEACIVDLTPPTFAGINFLDVESRGQIRAGWSAATDSTPPLRYEVYIQATTFIGLFNLSNIIASTPNLQYDIFTLPDGSFLQNGVTYYVGVRAVDGVGNRDNNTANQSVISTGVLTSIDTYESQAAWSINEDGDFVVTAWANKNLSIAKAPNDVLGSASFQVFKKDGTAVVGMSGTSVSANSEGLFTFTPVTNLIDRDNEHYELKISVEVDGEDRVNFISILPVENNIIIDGVADIDNNSNITGSFWVTENETILPGTRLGAGSYRTYTSDGTLIPALSETGIVANSDGFYVITPISLGSYDITKSFIVELEAEVNGETKTKKIVLGNQPAIYENKAVFSINASNQLEATFWAEKNQDLVGPTLLGTASYTIYDKNGVAVVGLTESGITADANGKFHITPVNAALLSDLTHYTAIISINVAGKSRVNVKGFTLLGN